MLMCLKSNWNWKCWFLRRAKNWSTLRKTSWSNDKNKQQTLPSCHQCQDLNQAIHWWEATVPPLASWVPSLNINTLIPYTVHYHFFFNSCGTIFIIFTHSHELYVWSSKNNTRRNEMPTTFVTVHYTFSLTAWLSPDLPFGGVGTNGTHRSHVKYLTIPTHSYNYDKQTLWVATAREFCIPSGPFTSNKSQINNKCWTFADVRWWQ